MGKDPRCGKPYDVKIGNHWYKRFCGKKPGHSFLGFPTKCGPK